MSLGSFDGLFRLDDPEEGWVNLITQVSSNIAGIAVSPNFAEDSTIAVAAYINGAFLSRDAGQNWQAVNSGLATEFEWERREDYVARLTGIAFYPTYGSDERMFIGERGYYLESNDSGQTWTPHLPDGILVEGEFPADYYIPAFSADFENDSTALLGTDGGKVFRYDGDAAAIEQVGSTGVEITALVLSTDFSDDEVAIAGTTEGLLQTTNGGRSLTPADGPARPITSLTTSDEFDEGGIAFAGTPSGLFKTTDGGSSWNRVQSEAIGQKAVIEAVVASPTYASDGTVLVSVNGLGLLRSTDGGATFSGLERACSRSRRCSPASTTPRPSPSCSRRRSPRITRSSESPMSSSIGRPTRVRRGSSSVSR